MTAGPVRYENKDGVGIITVDNPPLNVLSRAVRDGLMAAVREAAADSAASAVVLTGAGRTFTAGADITEFSSTFTGTDTNDICAAIEDMPKPVAVALHGTVLGGGVELALACHYRVAAKDARLGLPEVKLGLLPGCGGTQRLPRLTGAKPALDFIASGEPARGRSQEGRPHRRAGGGRSSCRRDRVRQIQGRQCASAQDARAHR